MRRCLVAMASSLNAGAASFAGLRSGVILLSLMTPRLGCRFGLECYGALAYFGASLRRSGRLREVDVRKGAVPAGCAFSFGSHADLASCVAPSRADLLDRLVGNELSCRPFHTLQLWPWWLLLSVTEGLLHALHPQADIDDAVDVVGVHGEQRGVVWPVGLVIDQPRERAFSLNHATA